MDWEQIVREWGPEVFRLARRITGRDEDAEDVVQDVFLEAHQYRGREPVRNWQALLRRRTAQRALDRLRRRRPTVALDSIEPLSRDAGPVTSAIASEQATQLRAAIAELPAQQAAVFCLRYFDGLTNAEIAESLGIGSGAVATSLHKAKQKLSSVFSGTREGADA